MWHHFLLLFFIFSGLGYSQEKIETIEVIESRSSLESSEEIKPNAIYFNSKKMVESLSYLPGLDVIDRTAPGISPEVSLRGAPAQNVKVMIDEIDYDMALIGNLDLFLWDSWLYDSAKVSKSNTSEAFIFNSGGGAIQLQSPGQSHLRAKSEVGSFDLKKFALSYGKEINQHFFLLQTSFAIAENKFSFKNSNNTPQVANDDYLDRRTNAGYQKGLIKTIYKLNSNKYQHQLSLTTNRAEQELPDINNSNLNRATLTTEYLIPSYSLQIKNKLKPTFIYYNLNKEERFVDNAGAINLVAQDFSSNYDVHAVNFKSGILSTDSFQLLGVIHWQDLEYSTHDRIANVQLNYPRNNTDFILKMRYFNPRFYSETLIGTMVSDDVTEKYHLANFAQDFSLSLNNLWRISSQFSLGQKLGSLEQLYGNSGFLTANANLRPEKIKAASLTQHLTWSRGMIELSYFQHVYQDLLVIYFDSRGVGKTQNAERSQAQGWEIFARYNFYTNWHFFSSITLQEVEYREGVKAGNQLPGRYAEKYSYGIEFERKQNQIAIDAQIFKDVYLDSSNLLKARDHLSLNLNYKRLFSAEMNASLSLNNITNEPNQLINGLPAFGQSFIVSFEYSGK